MAGSVFLTALSWAVRSLPNVVFGPIAGALADRYPRNRVLALNAVLRAAITLRWLDWSSPETSPSSSCSR